MAQRPYEIFFQNLFSRSQFETCGQSTDMSSRICVHFIHIVQRPHYTRDIEKISGGTNQARVCIK